MILEQHTVALAGGKITGVRLLQMIGGIELRLSYVAFTDSERLIGDGAKNQASMDPTNTVYDAKRLVGRKFDDASSK